MNDLPVFVQIKRKKNNLESYGFTAIYAVNNMNVKYMC
jgi:hypothetical protein